MRQECTQEDEEEENFEDCQMDHEPGEIRKSEVDPVIRDGKLKKGMCVEYARLNGELGCGLVLGRAGKATGKYGNCWNVEDKNTKQIEEFDVKKDWSF